MKILGIPLAGAALLLTLGLTTASVETVAASPTVSVTTNGGDLTVAGYDARYDARYDDRRDRRRFRARCYNDVHYGWRHGACVRVQQKVCRSPRGGSYVTDRYVVRVSRFHCR